MEVLKCWKNKHHVWVEQADIPACRITASLIPSVSLFRRTTPACSNNSKSPVFPYEKKLWLAILRSFSRGSAPKESDPQAMTQVPKTIDAQKQICKRKSGQREKICRLRESRLLVSRERASSR